MNGKPLSAAAKAASEAKHGKSLKKKCQVGNISCNWRRSLCAASPPALPKHSPEFTVPSSASDEPDDSSGSPNGPCTAA